MSVNPAGFIGSMMKPGSIDVPQGKDPQLWRKAKVFEAQFLSTVVEHSRTETNQGMFNDSFASKTWQGMLDKAQATAMTRSGGLGIAKAVYESASGTYQGGSSGDR